MQYETASIIFTACYIACSYHCEGLWYQRSRVRTRPKPSDFSGEKIHNMPSFGGEAKPSVPCRRFAASKRTLWLTRKSESQAKLNGHFSPVIQSFTNRGLSCHMMSSASGDDGQNKILEHKGPAAIGLGATGCSPVNATPIYIYIYHCENHLWQWHMVVRII
jgi:hypothetical protein